MSLSALSGGLGLTGQANDVAPKHDGAPHVSVLPTDVMAAADCMVGQAQGLELSKVVQRLQQQTQLLVSTPRQ
jgi:hypothetical protein